MFVSKMESTTEEVVAAKKPPLEHENKFKSSLHSKRETISKIIGVSSGPTYVYIVVSNTHETHSSNLSALVKIYVSKSVC